MFSAEQYRTKAAEYRALLSNIPRSPPETSEFRNLEQTYTTLAENEEWMAINIDKTIQRRKYRDNRTDLDEEDEQVLRCMGDGLDHAADTVATEAPTEAHW
jgi:hypothetical protein